MDDALPRIGLVGLGRIGLPLARNLIGAGHAVTGYRRGDPSDFRAAGGDPAGSAAEVAENSDVILSCLPDSDALRDVISGPRGVIGAGRPGRVVVEMSTLSLTAKERERQALLAAGSDMLDAPLSGTPDMVAAGRGVVFVSGTSSAHERARAALAAAVGERAPYVGPFGTGMKVKLAANTLIAVHTAAAAEMLGFAEACGLDADRMVAMIGPSAAGSEMLRAKGPLMAGRRFLPAPGPVAMLHKDVSLICDLAGEVGARMPLLAIAERMLSELIAEGRGGEDTASLITRFAPRAAEVAG